MRFLRWLSVVPLLVGALGLAGLGLGWLTGRRVLIQGGTAGGVPFDVPGSPFEWICGGLVLTGWLLVGGAVAGARRFRRGMAYSAASYLLVGLAWVLGLSLRSGQPLAAQAQIDPWALFAALDWPNQVALTALNRRLADDFGPP